MAVNKTKIVLDADVIIHFAKGGMLHLLPDILPEYQFIVLDIVKDEILRPVLTQLDNQIVFLKNIKEEKFGSSPEQRKEFLRLTSRMALGRGESACMVYCRYNHDVVGSSNTKDVTSYCDEHGITYLTTNDLLFYRIHRGIISKDDAVNFIKTVRQQGSYPPVVDFDTYVCTKI